MPLEMYRYIIGRDEASFYEVVEPGDYRTIINVKTKTKEEIIVVKCKEDDKLSYVYTIHPEIILEEGHPPIAAYDKSYTQNRSLVIRKGAEEIIQVSEKVAGRRKPLSVRYRLSHR